MDLYATKGAINARLVPLVDRLAKAGVTPDQVTLAAVPVAVRRRVLRVESLESGVPGGDLRASHLADIDALVTRWKGQGAVHLPGGVRATRDCGRLQLAPQQAAERR